VTTKFIPIEKLDKNQKYCIIGVPKCGTTSLGKYLRDKKYDVIEKETNWLDVGCAENYDMYDRTAIIIVRNPIERAWSDYNHWHRSLTESCNWSYYKAGLQMYDALIYSLEYLKTIPDFPHENKGINKLKITLEIKKKIINELNFVTFENKSTNSFHH